MPTRKPLISLLFVLSLSLALWLGLVPFRAQAQGEATPTPPPPPLHTPTSPPQATLPPGGGGKKPTATATRNAGGGGGSLPPTAIAGTPGVGTPTLTPTLTETPTPTLTPTPTIPPTLLRLAVYMDANDNGEFDTGEGVDHLLGLARWGETWLTYGYTVNGVLILTIPPDIPVGTQIAVETPYLHWSDQVKAPEISGLVETALRLELPEFPVFLP